MITAYGDVETRRKVLEGGAEALLMKPSILICFAVKSTAVSQGPSDRRLKIPGLQTSGNEMLNVRSSCALPTQLGRRAKSENLHNIGSDQDQSPRPRVQLFSA